MSNLEEYIYHLKRRNNPYRQTATSFSFLAKLNPIAPQQLQECKKYLQKLLVKSFRQSRVSKRPLIIGLAESGIIPSALMHQIARELEIEAYWICSTRRAASGLCFSERHSHQPEHVLPLFQHHSTEIWFVEDEITTGQTILNLILKLCPLLNVTSIRLFAFVDSRTPEEIIQFDNTLAKHHIQCSIQTLVHVKKTSQDTFELEATQTTSCSCQQPVTEKTINSAINSHNYYDWYYPERRPALNAQLNPILNLPTHLKGCLLAVGEVIDLALRLLQVNPALFLQHVTLSPWEIDRNKIFNYLEINSLYHIYNYKQLQSPVYILSDPLDRNVEWETKRLLLEKGLIVKSLSLDAIYLKDRYVSVR